MPPLLVDSSAFSPTPTPYAKTVRMPSVKCQPIAQSLMTNSMSHAKRMCLSKIFYVTVSPCNQPSLPFPMASQPEKHHKGADEQTRGHAHEPQATTIRRKSC